MIKVIIFLLFFLFSNQIFSILVRPPSGNDGYKYGPEDLNFCTSFESRGSKF